MRDATLEERCALTAGAAMWRSVAVPDAGIPSFTMSDGPMGIASGKVDERDIARLSPCATALGASWNRDLVQRIGTLVGQEAVTRGVDAVLAPNVNLARSPLAGRAFEYFSEDPVLAGELGAAWITGLQSTGTASVAKHLVCNDSETDRDTVDVTVDERTLREVYLLPFECAARAGCVGMLAAYNRVNGRYCAEQHHVLTEIVKAEWRYPGLIMSDWFGTHSTAPTINAGLDLEMPGPARFLGPKVTPLVQSGEVSADRVADAAARVAEGARRATGPKSTPLSNEAIDALLVEAAAEGFVLLKNDGNLLPIAPGSLKRLAVIGPNAAAPCFQGGTFAKISISPDVPSPADTIRAHYAPATEVVFEPGVDPQPHLPSMPVTPARDIGDGATHGMTLEYFASSDLSGEPLSRETRTTNSLVWFVGVHEQAHFADGGSIRASGVFYPTQAGVHRFYLGATGQARLLVGGREVLATRERPAGDVMGVLKSGEAEVAEVTLSDDTPVQVVVEFRFVPARVQGLWYGIRAPGTADELLARAVEAARSADAVVLMVGETSDSSVESKDRRDTRLAPEQVTLIERVTAANPRTVIVANVGHAFDTSWDGAVPALLSAWYPGEGFARALAEVLAGSREPGGRMPVSIAVSESDYPGYALKPDADGRLPYTDGTRFGYRGLIAAGTPARHAFGAGSGYSRFDWCDARADGDAVAVTVTNVSDRRGADVVQLYRDVPEVALVGFAKVALDPGETQRVRIPVPRRRLMTWSDASWQPIAPKVEVRVARHAEDPGTRLTLDLADLAADTL